MKYFLFALMLFLPTVALAEEDSRKPRVHMEGSSTVAPFALALSTMIKDEIDLEVVQNGTGAGFAALCGDHATETQMAGASRAVKPRELKICKNHDIETLVEVNLGLDGIVLAQSLKSRDMSLTARDLYVALAQRVPLSDTNCVLAMNRRSSWKEVRKGLPNRDIYVLGPPTTSGTRDAFIELAIKRGARTFPCLAELEKDSPEHFKAATELRQDGPWVDGGENDFAIAHTLTYVNEAIGIFGFSQLRQADNISPLSFEGVEPTREAIYSGDYTLGRPLYLYTTSENYMTIEDIPSVIDRFVSYEAIGVEGVLSGLGLIPTSKTGQQQLIDTTTGVRTKMDRTVPQVVTFDN